MLDMACLEATSINELVINSTQTSQPRQNRGASRDNNQRRQNKRPGKRYNNDNNQRRLGNINGRRYSKERTKN